MHAIRNGFTLIELLVVISIIGVLSTVAMTSLSGARIKAINAKKQVEFANISKALSVFYATYGRMPNNYPINNNWCEGGGSYEKSMQELVNAKLLAAIPASPDSRKYCYYNYGANTAPGALLVTTFQGIPSTKTGPSGSCRPFNNTNWCNTTQNTSYYCICTNYP